MHTYIYIYIYIRVWGGVRVNRLKNFFIIESVQYRQGDQNKI